MESLSDEFIVSKWQTCAVWLNKAVFQILDVIRVVCVMNVSSNAQMNISSLNLQKNAGIKSHTVPLSEKQTFIYKYDQLIDIFCDITAG